MQAIKPENLTGLHLFYSPFSNCATRVLLAIEEKELKVEKHLIDLAVNEQLSEEYIAINPKGEVPAIVHNGKAMHESVDILRYLEREFPEVSLSPKEALLKEQMDVWLDAAADSHHSGVVNYAYANGYGRLPTPKDWEFYQKYIPHRARFHEQRRQGLVACDKQQANQVLYTQFIKLEEALERQNYLIGNEYTLADIAWYPNTIILRLLGYSFKQFPNIRNWIKRIEARPAFKDRFRKELPPIPMCLLGLFARVFARLIRKTGNRS